MSFTSLFSADPKIAANPRSGPRRKFERLTPAEFGDANGGILIDAAEGGLRYQSVEPLTKGQRIRVKFALPVIGETVSAIAEIVWCNETGKSGGIRFESLPKQQREKLRKWVSEAARADTGPAQPGPDVNLMARRISGTDSSGAQSRAGSSQDAALRMARMLVHARNAASLEPKPDKVAVPDAAAEARAAQAQELAKHVAEARAAGLLAEDIPDVAGSAVVAEPFVQPAAGAPDGTAAESASVAGAQNLSTEAEHTVAQPDDETARAGAPDSGEESAVVHAAAPEELLAAALAVYTSADSFIPVQYGNGFQTGINSGARETAMPAGTPEELAASVGIPRTARIVIPVIDASDDAAPGVEQAPSAEASLGTAALEAAVEASLGAVTQASTLFETPEFVLASDESLASERETLSDSETAAGERTFRAAFDADLADALAKAMLDAIVGAHSSSGANALADETSIPSSLTEARDAAGPAAPESPAGSTSLSAAWTEPDAELATAFVVNLLEQISAAGGAELSATEALAASPEEAKPAATAAAAAPALAEAAAVADATRDAAAKPHPLAPANAGSIAAGEKFGILSAAGPAPSRAEARRSKKKSKKQAGQETVRNTSVLSLSTFGPLSVPVGASARDERQAAPDAEEANQDGILVGDWRVQALKFALGVGIGCSLVAAAFVGPRVLGGPQREMENAAAMAAPSAAASTAPFQIEAVDIEGRRWILSNGSAALLPVPSDQSFSNDPVAAPGLSAASARNDGGEAAIPAAGPAPEKESANSVANVASLSRMRTRNRELTRQTNVKPGVEASAVAPVAPPAQPARSSAALPLSSPLPYASPAEGAVAGAPAISAGSAVPQPSGTLPVVMPRAGLPPAAKPAGSVFPTIATPYYVPVSRGANTPAVLVERYAPAYPQQARDQGIEGTVQVNVTVDKNGVPREMRALSGDSWLMQAAVTAISRWRYRPAMQNGKPVDSQMVVDIPFTLR